MSLGTSQPVKRIRGGKADSLALIAGLAAVVLTAAAFLLIAPTAGQTAPGETAANALETFAGIPPVAYLVKRIGGPHVRVEVLVKPGQDPHIFEPTPRQVVRLSKARLFFKIGIPFEDRLTERISADNAKIAIVDASAGIARRTGPHPNPLPDGEGTADDDDAGADPHVWLAPQRLKQMAANIATALSTADPAHEQDFRENQTALDAELDVLDRRLATSLAPYRGQTFYVFHPAFGYFADAYGLRQESVEIEGKSPTPRQLVSLIQKARADHVKIIFLQPRFNKQAAEAIAQSLGGAVMTMDDLAYDVVANLNNIATTVGNALSKAPDIRRVGQASPASAGPP